MPPLATGAGINMKDFGSFKTIKELAAGINSLIEEKKISGDEEWYGWDDGSLIIQEPDADCTKDSDAGYISND